MQTAGPNAFKILENHCRLRAKFHTDHAFLGQKGRRRPTLQRAKAERLIFADGALNEGVLFCVLRFGGLGLAADHVLKAIACRGLLRRLR